MRFWAVLTAIVSLWGGVAEVDGDEARSLEKRPGYSAEGDGFYVWDEDCDEATKWASELAESTRNHGTS